MKNKFWATIRNVEGIEEKVNYMLKRGISCFRVNLARSNFTKNQELIDYLLRNNVKKLFLDLPGNKKRICRYNEKKYISLKKGDELKIFSREVLNENAVRFEDCDELQKHKVGEIISFGDGDVIVEIENKLRDCIVVKCLRAGEIKSHSGYLNISGYVPQIELFDTEKKYIDCFDNKKVIWGISFADTETRVKECGKVINKGEKIAKIETPVSVSNIEKILESADGGMLARGDLTNFYDISNIDLDIHFRIREACMKKHKDYYVATNYFCQIGQKGTTSSGEINVLRNIIRDDRIKGIISNETSYSAYWKEIIEMINRLNSGSFYIQNTRRLGIHGNPPSNNI